MKYRMPYIEIAKNEAEERNSNQIRDSYSESKQRDERRSDILQIYLVPIILRLMWMQCFRLK